MVYKNTRILEIEKGTESLASYARDLGDDVLILTSNEEPVAMMVLLGGYDKDSLALGINPESPEIIERSREETRAGKTLSLNELRSEFSIES